MPTIQVNSLVEKTTGAREAKVLEISAKCSDYFAATLVDDQNESIFEYDGYVPEFFPGDHYGDYVQLNIDLETGRILNWVPPTAEQLEAWVNGKSDE